MKSKHKTWRDSRAERAMMGAVAWLAMTFSKEVQ
jgi:hypothetical protein